MGLNMSAKKNTSSTNYYFVLLAVVLLIACSKNYSYKENAMPESVPLSPKLKELFKETKLACFGRYAITLPKEAQLIWGNVSFPSKIFVFRGDRKEIKELV